MTAPRCLWCGENHPTETIRMGEIEVSSCPRLGTNEGVMFSRPDPVAAVRFEDGTQVVAFAAPGLEVRAFGVEEAIRVVDLDERGMPREKP